MEELEIKVLSLIESKNKAVTYEELEEKLTKEEIEKLPEVLVSLEKNLKIRVTNKGKYEKFHDRMQKVGTIIINPKGFGFVMVEGEEEDYYVSKNNLNGAINGDVVVINVINEQHHDATVLRINERNLKDLLVGEFYKKDDKNFIKLDDSKLKIIVEIKDEDAKGAVPGHKVVVKIENNIAKSNYYQGKIVKIIGHKDDPGVDILSIAAHYNIFDEFPKEVIEQLENVPEEVSEKEKLGRKDFRDKMIFTIDGDDTKDIDDAISIDVLPNGNYSLGVHIADVSYYVKEGTPLYEEALTRGTSSYLADRVIPMLPHQLSNGICSLNPEVDRLAISCIMEIDDKGNNVSSEIFESVIRSRKQMTYKNVNKIIEEDIIPEGYEPYAEKLKQMHELAKIIRKNKVNKGYIDFDIDEPKIIVDETGKAIDVQKRERGEGEKLIEDFMICANEAVASTIFYMDLPFVYRVHDLPDEEKVSTFLKFTGILGYHVNANTKNITPKTIQSILGQLKDKKEYPILSSMLLRSMKKAIYDVNNIGHFGLASKCYTHFTSPIRRFPDLTVHRLLRTYLFKHNINNETINALEVTLPAITKQSSDRERVAVDCERAVTDMKMAEYMENHIGERYKGVINTVTKYGMYVELPNLVEGLVKVEDLNDDYYYYQEESFSLIGKNKKRVYTLGQELEVEVSNVSKEKGQIDFIIPKGAKNGNIKQESQI